MRDMHRMRERIELQLDNRQIVSFVIGSLVVLGVVFALGVLVGKQLAMGGQEAQRPADPLAALDAAEKNRLQPEAVRGTGELPEAAAAEAAPAAEAARATGKVAAAGPDAGAAEAKPAPLTYAEVLTAKGHNPDAAAAKAPEPAKKKDEAARVETKQEEPAPEPVERKSGLAAAFDKASGKPAASGAYCLQVASLPTREDADKVASKLKAKGVSPHIVEADLPRGRYYRVRVGSYATRSEAEEALATLKRTAGTNAIVTSAK